MRKNLNRKRKKSSLRIESKLLNLVKMILEVSRETSQIRLRPALRKQQEQYRQSLLRPRKDREHYRRRLKECEAELEGYRQQEREADGMTMAEL